MATNYTYDIEEEKEEEFYSNYESDYEYDSDAIELAIAKQIYRYANDINVVFEFLTIFANLFHLSILLQKELRSISIFVLMIGICIVDIFGFITDFLEHALERNWLLFLRDILLKFFPYHPYENCISYDYMIVRLPSVVHTLIVQASRPISIWLAIMMALIRALSVMFPMSSVIQKLTSYKVAIVMVLCVGLFWCGYYSYHCFFWKWVWFPDNTNYMCLFLDPNMTIPEINILVFPMEHYDVIQSRENIEYLVRLLPTVFYPLLTISLFIELRRIKNRRNKMKVENQKSDNTTKLVLFMTVSFMLSEGLAGIMKFIVRKSDEIVFELFDLVLWSGVVQDIVNNFRSINAFSHVFVCYAMSSQYRDTVKKLFCCCKLKRKQDLEATASDSQVFSSRKKPN